MKHALASRGPTRSLRPETGLKPKHLVSHGWPAGAELGLGTFRSLPSPAALSREAQQSQILAELLTSPIGLLITRSNGWITSSHTTARHSFKLGADIRTRTQPPL